MGTMRISVEMWNVYVDGQLWIDADGNSEFTYFELGALYEELEARGYLNIDADKV